jgi:hypothetical protein
MKQYPLSINPAFNVSFTFSVIAEISRFSPALILFSKRALISENILSF